MQAIILAAGMGKRLKELTRDNTKCMVKVNGVTLIERMLKQLDKLNLSKVVIVVGYEGKKLINYIGGLKIDTPITFIDNPVYYKTNNIYSLSLAKEYLCMEDTILLESDLIFEDDVLKELVEDERDTLALVDKYESWMDGTVIKIDDQDHIQEFIPGKKFIFEDIPYYYKTVNIYKFAKDFSNLYYVPFLEAYTKALGNNEYYEQVLRVITLLDTPVIRAKRINGKKWYEIDDIQDLDIASSIVVNDDDERLFRVQQRWGGYWRHPKLKDFCCPTNPYFPPKRLLDELKANLDNLVTAYPSGMDINALLVAKNLGVGQKNVSVANGVEEIINIVMTKAEGKIGVVKPTNEEYINRYKADNMEIYVPENDDLSYSAKDIMLYFGEQNISMLILVNPDYHSGNYIPKADMRCIIQWCENKNIDLLLDESYCDFSDERDASMLFDNEYERYQRLLILRNLSVAQGVSGLRLGCAISGNIEKIDELKKDMTIWNINSVAEFYLQIEEKYRKNYTEALEKVKIARRKFQAQLAEIEGLRVIPSQANYIMCEVCGGWRAHELTKVLLIKYDILIKDLTDRVESKKQYIKLAIRREEENEMLVAALKEIFAGERVAGTSVHIDNERTKEFFESRTDKKLPHRYNYVIYQDNNPELALERDKYEKQHMKEMLDIQSENSVLDIGCGVGRWGDEIVKILKTGKYIGIDYSKEFLQIAEQNLADSGKCFFAQGTFQNVEQVLDEHGWKRAYDRIFINGVLMYINDEEIGECLKSVDALLAQHGKIYIKESVGVSKRFTLKDFYSSELGSCYNAIYRALQEYEELFKVYFPTEKYEVQFSGTTWQQQQENRKETTSYYWVIKKNRV